MASFILRNIDPAFWDKVRTKAAAQHTTIKAVILRLLATWLALPLVSVIVGTTPAAAQPPDPRLGSVHSAWIELTDDLSDAQPVAACFAQFTPVALAATRAQADVILRFSSMNRRQMEEELGTRLPISGDPADTIGYGLGAFLPDSNDYFVGTALWTRGVVILHPRDRLTDDRECKSARQLATQFREAMRRARGY